MTTAHGLRTCASGAALPPSCTELHWVTAAVTATDGAVLAQPLLGGPWVCVSLINWHGQPAFETRRAHERMPRQRTQQPTPTNHVRSCRVCPVRTLPLLPLVCCTPPNVCFSCLPSGRPVQGSLSSSTPLSLLLSVPPRVRVVRTGGSGAIVAVTAAVDYNH